VPVVIAGGPKTETDMEFLQMIEGAMQAGARGVAIGRNVFQHEDPVKMTMAIAAIVNKGKKAKEAAEVLKGNFIVTQRKIRLGDEENGQWILQRKS